MSIIVYNIAQTLSPTQGIVKGCSFKPSLLYRANFFKSHGIFETLGLGGRSEGSGVGDCGGCSSGTGGGGVGVGGEDGVGDDVICIGACVLSVISYVTDGIMVVSLSLWYGRRNHRFCRVIEPEPSKRIWYCRSSIFSVMMPVLSHFFECCRWLPVFWIRTGVLNGNGWSSWAVVFHLLACLIFCLAALYSCCSCDTIQSLCNW